MKVIASGREVEFTPADTAKAERARKLCAALLVEASSRDAADEVEQYLAELATLLGGSYTPA